MTPAGAEACLRSAATGHVSLWRNRKWPTSQAKAGYAEDDHSGVPLVLVELVEDVVLGFYEVKRLVGIGIEQERGCPILTAGWKGGFRQKKTPPGRGFSSLRKSVGSEQAEVPHRYGGQDHGGAVDDRLAAVGHRLCHGGPPEAVEILAVQINYTGRRYLIVKQIDKIG